MVINADNGHDFADHVHVHGAYIQVVFCHWHVDYCGDAEKSDGRSNSSFMADGYGARSFSSFAGRRPKSANLHRVRPFDDPIMSS